MDPLADFEIQALSDEDYEDLIVEVLYRGEFCFLISQEEGFERIRIAIHPRKDGEPWDFRLKDLETALKKAADLLWELRRADS